MVFARRAGATTRMAGIISAGTLLVALLAPTVVAAGGGTTVVRGVQHEYGSCGNADGYLMEGSLVGCWWVDTFIVKPHPAKAGMLATGTEHFDGCLGAVCGTFWTTYTYTARFDGATELHGRCHHPIQGGTDGFAGVRGELSFTDVVDSEPFSYPYWGNIHLDRSAAREASFRTVASRTTARATSAVAPC